MADEHEGHRERLKQRYLAAGEAGFTEKELLELLLTYAIPRRDTAEPAAALLARFGTLREVFRAPKEALASVPGIGESTAVFLKLQGDMQRRTLRSGLDTRKGAPVLNTPSDTAAYVYSLLSGRQEETLLMVALDARNTVLGHRFLGSGGLSSLTVYPRTVVEQALLLKADAVLIAHNHPSGDPSPSDEDRLFTEDIRAALATVGIRFPDHLVAGNAAVYSFSSGCILYPSL